KEMREDSSPEGLDFDKAETTVSTYTFQRPYYNVLVFNVRHPVLKNAEVRRALTEALDKETLVKDGMRGRGRPADGPLVPEHWAYSPPAHPLVYDPDAAVAALDRARMKARPVPDRATPR